MKNITFSADANLIEAARHLATVRNTTLNAEFRVWLSNYVQHATQGDQAMRTVDELRGKLQVGRKVSREEANER